MTKRKDCYDALKIENQLCFPLYVAAKETIRSYKPFLDELDLTYTQYITMTTLWEKGEASVNELGECLYLDSGTLTPLLKKLESKGYVNRKRCETDERKVVISLTEEGLNLRDRALSALARADSRIALDSADATRLRKMLYSLLEKLQN